MKKYLPQFFPEFWMDEYGIYGLPFVEEICIGFIEREDGAYSYLLNKDFLNLGITSSELLKISIKNLESEFEDCDIKVYKLKGGKVAFWNSENDNFTAVILLSSKYSSTLNEIFESNFYFSIPDRDLITCWATTDIDENEKFENEALEDYENSEYGLSRIIYTLNDIKIS